MAGKCLERKLCNVAFNSFFLLRDLDKCIETLLVSKRYSEAAFFSKAYCPSHIRKIVELWKNSLQKTYPLTAMKLADPMEYEENFELLSLTHQIELNIKEKIKLDVGSENYDRFKEELSKDLLAIAEEFGVEQGLQDITFEV